MKFCSLFSGSSGNCIFVSSGITRILIDAGVSLKKTEQELDTVGESIDDIDAMLVTHEHGDHIKSLGVFLRKKEIPVYLTHGTYNAMIKGKIPIGDHDKSLIHFVEYENDFMIGDILVSPFKVSHDAEEPVAYCFTCEGKKIGVATDLGFYNTQIYEKLVDSKVLYIESNHDERMLDAGIYPYYLKERIKSDLGHLSNDTCAELVSKICNDPKSRLSTVILGHLSEENNFPDLAYETVNAEVKLNVTKEKRPEIYVAPRNGHSYIAEV